MATYNESRCPTTGGRTHSLTLGHKHTCYMILSPQPWLRHHTLVLMLNDEDGERLWCMIKRTIWGKVCSCSVRNEHLCSSGMSVMHGAPRETGAPPPYMILSLRFPINISVQRKSELQCEIGALYHNLLSVFFFSFFFLSTTFLSPACFLASGPSEHFSESCGLK